MGPYKRCELAAKVESLAVITAPLKSFDTEYFETIKKKLNHANWLNFDKNWQYSRISLAKIPRIINQCRVGIVLSKVEGACYSAIEYMLCGLPVVSTPSRGGRDEFFTDYTSIIVERSEVAVAQGVEQLIALNIDPLFVREHTLKLVEAHRARLFDLVNRIWYEHGINRDLTEEWTKLFKNKMNYKGTVRFASFRSFLVKSSFVLGLIPWPSDTVSFPEYHRKTDV